MEDSTGRSDLRKKGGVQGWNVEWSCKKTVSTCSSILIWAISCLIASWQACASQKTAVAVAYCKRGVGLLKLNGNERIFQYWGSLSTICCDKHETWIKASATWKVSHWSKSCLRPWDIRSWSLCCSWERKNSRMSISELEPKEVVKSLKYTVMAPAFWGYDCASAFVYCCFHMLSGSKALSGNAKSCHTVLSTLFAISHSYFACPQLSDKQWQKLWLHSIKNVSLLSLLCIIDEKKHLMHALHGNLVFSCVDQFFVLVFDWDTQTRLASIPLFG